MCGIAGFLLRKREVDDRQIDQMVRLLTRRGPDEVGIYNDINVCLGHRRLSIIDLSTGQQPMWSDDRTKVIVFNGEIYNFNSIKEELMALGSQFKTTSDTEVILKGYEVFGLQGMLKRMEGMFAFALWDSASQKIFIVRDRYGEKPLYYLNDERGFFFASELKALQSFIIDKTLDKEALNLFLTLTYIPAPFSIYKSVRKLMPGQILEADLSGIRLSNYYSLKDTVNISNATSSYISTKDELRKLLFDSVKSRMISDVPIGAFLSGGIDSSIITAIMSKYSKEPINTFSIGFKEKYYDETERSNLVARHVRSNHTSYTVTPEDLLTVSDKVIDYFDEPFADSSALPSFIVAQKAREKVKVVLTGDCADELFGGYEKYLASHYAKWFIGLPQWIRSLIRKIVDSVPHNQFTNHTLRKVKKVLSTSLLSSFGRHYQLMALGFDDTTRKQLVVNSLFRDVRPQVERYFSEIHADDEMNRSFYTDVNLVLEGDMLTKVDRMCMMNSLEARVPFLDSKIVEASFKMPVSFKIKGTNKKKILKETFSDLLPAKIFRLGKKGFGVPVALWFRNELKGELERVLDKSLIEKYGILNFEFVSKLFQEHQSGKENHSSKLWTLYVFQKWCIKNL